MTYTSQREAGSMVRHKVPFKGSNVYAESRVEGAHAWYVVYSYGTHFPMYIFDYTSEQWLGNNDKYSPSTSRHQRMCRPPNVHHWYSTALMQRFAVFGFIPVTQARLCEEAA
jgi:hypothetical protein